MTVNLMLTGSCNMDCPYCFAESPMDEARKRRQIVTLERAQTVLDFLKRSGQRRFSVMGGEPTLHPYFKDIVQLALDQDFEIKVMTNGAIPEHHLRYLSGLDPERLALLVNANPEAEVPPAQWKAMERTFAVLHSCITLSYSLDSKDDDLDFMIELIQRFDLRRGVRMGLAMPVLGGKNRYLPLEDYPAAAERIVRFVEKADRLHARVYGECGLTLCMFTDEQLGKLQRANADFKPRCEPALDLSTDLQAFHCFPLAKFKVPLAGFEDVDALTAFFDKKVRPFKHLGSLDACLPCTYRKRGQCFGGCLAFTLDKLDPAFLAEHFAAPNQP